MGYVIVIATSRTMKLILDIYIRVSFGQLSSAWFTTSKTLPIKIGFRWRYRFSFKMEDIVGLCFRGSAEMKDEVGHCWAIVYISGCESRGTQYRLTSWLSVPVRQTVSNY